MDSINQKKVIKELEERSNKIFAKVRDEGAIRPHKEIRYDQSNMVRMERAISWLSKGAGLQDEEPGMAFIAYWISFEAIYSNDAFLVASDSNHRKTITALDRITTFISDLIERTVVEQVSEQLSNALEEVWPQVESLFVNSFISPESWRQFYEKTTKAGAKHNPFAMEQSKPRRSGLRDTKQFNALTRHLFQRLYYVRNMIFHGNATYKDPDNKDRTGQIHDGLKVLSVVVPVLVSIMLEEMENDIKDDRWGKVPYPRIKDSSDG